MISKLRGGPFTNLNQPSDWPSGRVIATGDLNNDLRADLVVATAENLEIIFGGTSERVHIPLGGFKVTTLKLMDYDNDGWLDLVAGGDGLRAWRNAGRAGFADVTSALGLDKVGGGPIETITSADFDGDCDTDLLLSRPGAPLQLLRNNGGNANHQMKIVLYGRRSNPTGLGIRLELTASGLHTSRTISQLPIEIGVGSRTQVDSINARWFDLEVNTIELKVECPQLLVLDEPVIPGGSCPYLYAWDGRRFRFVTDLLGAAPLGLRLTDDRFVDADEDEFVHVGDEASFPPQGSNYVLQITEELREVLYLDEAKLVVVDHPAGTEVHTTGKLLPGPPFPPHQIVTLQNRIALRQALNHEGTDVTALLAEIDGKFVSPTKLRAPQLRGLAEPHHVTLDFGPLDPTRPLVLALTGWLRFGGGMANVGASHNPDLPFPFPALEVETRDRGWQKLDIMVGAPAGKTKTILVDLAGKLPSEARRLRLATAFEIHWDRIGLFEKRDNAETHMIFQTAKKGDLHRRGYSEFEDLPWSMPLTPNYDKVSPYAHWRITPEGWCTRYGDVRELIQERDNALALVAGGDELTLQFSANQLPSKSAKAVRDFFLFTSGWDKDADFHCELGWQVEPLPWHGLDSQRYGHENRPPFANDGWKQKFNTRWVGPYTLTWATRLESVR